MTGSLKFYWKLLLRRLPVMAILFLVCTGLGVVLAMRLPTTYEASARLLVESPQISTELAASTVQVSATEGLEVIRQQLLTRANLLELARQFNVFPPEENMAPDDMVAGMRDATTISSGRGRGTPTIVDVRFEARTGQIAANVVNEYVTRITSANVRNRTGAAEETLDFFEQEVARLSGELDQRSSAISDFQRENAGSLPDGQQFRLNRQSLLQERISAAAREVSALRQQRQRLIELFEATGSSTADSSAAQSPEERRLQALERELEDALAIYSSTNPRVVQLQARVERARQDAADAASREISPAATDSDVDPRQTLFDLQMSEIDSRIVSIENRVAQDEDELAGLRTAIDQTPLNAITLASLQRDYENVRKQYDSSVQRMSQASVGERIELTARGQRITLIEAANVPRAPASPNRPLVAMAGVAAGLGLAAAFFILLELLNSAVRRPVDIQKGLGILPLATIPYIESSQRRLMRRAGQIMAMLVVLVGVPAGLWAIDTYYQPLDILAQRIMTRVGLT